MKKNNKYIVADNLNAKEKRIALIFIALMILSISIFILCRQIRANTEDEQLVGKSNVTVAFVTGRWYTRLQGNIFSYMVKSKSYKLNSRNSILLNDGEKYIVKYSRNNPKINKIYLTKPVVSKSDIFISGDAIINRINIESEPNIVCFDYLYNNNSYSRKHYVTDASIYKVGKKYSIVISKRNPLISYLGKIYN